MTVLDTNFLVYLLKNKSSADVADYYNNPKTTSISLFELYYGAWNSLKSQENILKIKSLLKTVEMLEFDKPAAEEAGRIHSMLESSGESIELQDILIAGIVISRNEELVTNNIKHFRRIPGLKYSPWQPSDYGR